MRPSIPRYLRVLSRTDIPKPQLECIKPMPTRPSERPPTLTLIDHLRERQKERMRQYAEARSKQKEGVEIDAKPWPKNLRVEPIVKREELSTISKDVRMQVKDALKER